jgi:hypothetical protein
VPLAVALCALAVAAAATESPAGPRLDRPLGVVTPGTLRLLVLDLPLLDARGEAAGLEARWEVANDWTRPTTLSRGGRTVAIQLDEQADLLTLAAALPWSRLAGTRAWAERLSTRLEWRLVRHGGGWTDRPIEAWHALTTSNRFGRPDFPRDAVALQLAEPGGARVFALQRARLAAGDAALRTALRLLEGARLDRPWAVAARLDVKVPLGRPSEAGGSGGLDVGTGLAVSLPLLPWLTGHAQLTLRRVAPLPGGLPLRLRRWQEGAEASLVASRGGWALLLETRFATALFERGWRVAGSPAWQGDALTAATRGQNQVAVGLRWCAVTAWLLEDFTLGSRSEVGWRWFYDSNAPDLALGASLTVPY